MFVDHETIDKIMTSYTKSLSDELGENLKAVVLFGSRARGDHTIDSDIDVFVMVEDNNSEVKRAINNVSNKVDWDYDTLLSNITRSSIHYHKFYNETLFQNIRKEGLAYYGTI